MTPTYHRTRLARGIGMLIVMLLVTVSTSALAQVLLDATAHPKFVNPLPRPARVDLTQGGRLTLEMKETVQSYGLVAPDATPLLTTVRGYGEPGAEGMGMKLPTTSPGPTLVAMRDVPVDIRWNNKVNRMYDFPNGAVPHLLPVDPNLHIAHVNGGGVLMVTHLHGGHTESASDGLPEAWFTQNFQERGPHFVKKTYTYHNDQEAATLWYHDHALGITRLNVYAGLAGFYLLRDQNENNLVATGVLPGEPYEVEIVIQDRMFTADGQLFYPSTNPEIEPGFEPLPAGPSAIAEFFGDFIMVNGAVWPYLNVEPRKYRLRYLNGSDSRFYVLEFHDAEVGGNAIPFMQIGTDDALLANPVQLTRLLLAPGERADLVVDFTGYTNVYQLNFGPDDPFKGFNPDGTIADGAGGVAPAADPATTGKIMKFNVNLPMDANVPNATVTTASALRPAILPLAQTGATRQLVLFEGLDQYGRLQPLLGTLVEGSLAWFEPITENPMVDDVEVWEVYNATEDGHPIHLHLVAFQIINRESFEGTVLEKPQPQHGGGVGVGGQLTGVTLGGDVRGPEPNEMGWKDTAVMLPGEVTRVIAKFDRAGRYVWHCHILSHEDHEMMRPYHVGPIPPDVAGPPFGNGWGVDGGIGMTMELAGKTTLGQNYPNPFNPSTQIRFQLSTPGHAELNVYDVQGKLIRTLADGTYAAGEHLMHWDGLDNAGNELASGVYFYKLTAGGQTYTKRMVMVR